jgi:hypothetical protein
MALLQLNSSPADGQRPATSADGDDGRKDNPAAGDVAVIRGGAVTLAEAAGAFMSSPRTASPNTRRAYASVIDRARPAWSVALAQPCHSQAAMASPRVSRSCDCTGFKREAVLIAGMTRRLMLIHRKKSVEM